MKPFRWLSVTGAAVLVLTAAAWMEMVDLTGAFCIHQDHEVFQWLNHDGEVSLLLSPNGQW